MPAAEQGVAVSAGRYQLIPRVLCFVWHGPDVLLLKGAPDKKIWANKYNGLGGHVERGESVPAAALREIREEAGLAVCDLRLRGVVTIDTGEAVGIGLFVFSAEALDRTVKPSREGSLHWVSPAELAGLVVVEDLPELLARVQVQGADGPCFGARYSYSVEGKLHIDFFEAEAAGG